MSKLKFAILKKYGTQYKFSQVLGTREETVCRVITGRRQLAPHEQQQWAALLDCPVSELFSEKAA